MRIWVFSQLKLIVVDDALFSTGAGLERVGVVGLDQDYWRIELEAAGSPGLKRVRVAGSVPG